MLYRAGEGVDDMKQYNAANFDLSGVALGANEIGFFYVSTEDGMR